MSMGLVRITDRTGVANDLRAPESEQNSECNRRLWTHSALTRPSMSPGPCDVEMSIWRKV